jgi:hypothetical protein
MSDDDDDASGRGRNPRGAMRSVPRRPPNVANPAAWFGRDDYRRLMLEDGSVLIPPGVAGGFVRVAGLGLSVLFRNNDGGEVTREAIEVFHALQRAATRENERRRSARGTADVESEKVSPVGELTTGQAASLLEISPRAVRKACDVGRILARRVNGRWAIDPAHFDDFRMRRSA